MGKLLVTLVAVAACLAVVGVSFYGLYLAFSASIILGILALVVEPAPLVFGLVALAFHKNLPGIIVGLLR